MEMPDLQNLLNSYPFIRLLPRVILFRRQYGITDGLTQDENYIVRRKIAKREGRVLPKERPGKPAPGLVYNPISDSWVPDPDIIDVSSDLPPLTLSSHSEKNDPMEEDLECYKKETHTSVWIPSKDGVAYKDLPERSKVVGTDGMSLVQIREKKYIPVPMSSSGRKDILGEPIVPPMIPKQWIDAKIEVSDGKNHEWIDLAITDMAIRNTVSSEIVSQAARDGKWTVGSHFAAIRKLINHDDFDRNVVATTILKSQDVLEMTVFAEIYETEKKAMAAQAEKQRSQIHKSMSAYVSVGRFYYDVIQMSENFKDTVSRGTICQFLPKYLVANIPAQVVGMRSIGSTSVEILAPCPPGPEYVEMLSLTRFKALFPRMCFDSTLPRFEEEKIVIIDVEYAQKLFVDATQMVCPIAAITVIVGKDIKRIKYYTDPTGCEGMTGSKCQSVLAIVGKRIMGDDVFDVPFVQNKGIAGFREDVQYYHDQGYKIVAKGSQIEARVLADLGVSQPLANSERRKVVDYLVDPGTHPNSGVPLWTAPKCRGPNGTRSFIKVWELGGLPYDKIKKAYFDRYDWEFLLEIYESGHHSLKHHPLSETFLFAHHYISNKYLAKYYLETRCVSTLRYEYETALKDRLRASSNSSLSNSSKTIIVDAISIEQSYCQCQNGCLPSCPFYY